MPLHPTGYPGTAGSSMLSGIASRVRLGVSGYLRPLMLILLFAALALPIQGQADQSESESLLRVIQGLESLRYEILQEQKRFQATAMPAGVEELEQWRAISEDVTLTLAQIDAAITEHRQRFLEIADPVEAPPPAAMPPLLPE